MSSQASPPDTGHHGRRPARRLYVRARAVGAAALGVVALGACAQGAMAFGTWDTPIIPGYAEHERITRMAVQCEGAFAKDPTSPLAQAAVPCAQPRSATQVAGTTGYLGGVGAPDSAYDAINSKSPQHCDDGDYLFGATSYPQAASERDRHLLACRALFDLYMADAVRSAGEIVPVVSGTPTLAPSQADLSGGNCNDDYDRKYNPGQVHGNAAAKCNALISFGRAMHMAQDFFSHSNWIDDPWPASVAPIGLLNPPGLLRVVTTPAQVPDFVRYPRTAEEITAFLAANPVVTGGYTGTLTGRVTHDTRGGNSRGLAKDMGSARIDWTTGAIPVGKKERGVTGVIGGQDNFQRAAYAAATTTATAWGDLQQAVRAAYPGARGEMAARALGADTPWTACAMSGSASKALAPTQPTRDMRALLSRAVTVNVTNQSGRALECTQAVLNRGAWSPLPPDSLAAGARSSFRTQNDGAMTAGTEGSVTLRADGDPASSVTIRWSNPLYGSNTSTCTTSGSMVCRVSGGTGNDATLDVAILDPTVAAVRERTSITAPKSAVAARGSRAVRATPTAVPVDVPMTRAQIRAFAARASDIRACGGRAAAINLRVAGVPCGWTVRALLALSEDLCPPAWRYQPGAKTARVVCYQRRAGVPGDAGIRAFAYVIPHFRQGHSHP